MAILEAWGSMTFQPLFDSPLPIGTIACELDTVGKGGFFLQSNGVTLLP